MLLTPVVLVPLLLQLAAGQTGLEVQTASGPVVGSTRYSQAGAPYGSWEGIPFAAPPVGKLRFGAPQPAAPWTEPLDVSGTHTNKCIQFGYISEGGGTTIQGSEDCLYLNIWAPLQKKEESLPIMMWIYGGSLTAGSKNFNEYGPMRWIDQDVIIVNPAYRLGPFGFTTLGIEEAPGNQGFLDLVAALQWINANAEAFGGDPNRVTIFGESSGSWAVSYLHLSPLAKGLFQRAILQSGSLFNPYWLWRTEQDGLLLSNFLTETLQCPTTALADPYGALECFQDMPLEVLESSINWGTDETFQIQKILRPTGYIDGKFLPDHPVKMMARGEYNHVDLMVGLTKDEGLLQTYQLELHPELYGVLPLMWDKTFGPMFLFGKAGDYETTEEDRRMSREITKFYFGESGSLNIGKHTFQNLTDMISDAYIWYGAHKQAGWAAQQGDNVYQYMFSFKGTYGFADAFGLENSNYGVCHADELYYFWKPYWNKASIQFPESEDLLSQRLLQAWANFAKFGDPSVPGEDIYWSQVTSESHDYMNIGQDWSMELSQNYLDRMNVWDSIYSYPEGNTLPTPLVDVDVVQGVVDTTWIH